MLTKKTKKVYTLKHNVIIQFRIPVIQDKCCPNNTTVGTVIEDMKVIIAALQSKVQSRQAADVMMKNKIQVKWL